MLADCSEELGGVPKVVLADRMGCLKGGVVANKVVPTAEYVRFASALLFPAGLVRGRRPRVEGHRGEPRRLCQAGLDRPAGPVHWYGRSQCGGPPSGVRRSTRRALGDLRGPGRAAGGRARPAPGLPSLRPAMGRAGATRKVDRLSCARFGSARYSVPTRLIGQQVAVPESAGRLLVTDTATGEVVASMPRRPRARHRYLMSITAGPGPRRAGRCARRPRQRKRSAASAPPPGHSSPGRRPRETPGWPRTWTSWPRSAPRTATRRYRGGGTGGGVPPLAGRRRPVHPGRRGRHPAALPRRGGNSKIHSNKAVTSPRTPRRDVLLRIADAYEVATKGDRG